MGGFAWVRLSFVVVGLAGFLTSACGGGGGAEKPTRIPTPAYTSDAARATAEVGAGKSAVAAQAIDRANLRAEVNSGAKRLDALPTVEILGTNIGPATFAQAVATSDIAVTRGHVVKQQAFDGFVLSTVNVDQAEQGAVRYTQIIVAQVGGPVIDGGHPAAAQLTTDPLLKLGQTYVLFLTSCTGYDDSPTRDIACIAGNGRQFEVVAGRIKNVVKPEGWLAQFEGMLLDDFERQMVTVQVADATPIPGATPDKTKPDWYVPYLNFEKTMPKFSGEINGIALGQPDGPTPQCSQPQIDPRWEDALRGTAFDLNLDALPTGVRLSGTPRIGRCGDDGRVMWVIAAIEVSPRPGVDGDLGVIQVSRWEAVRWYSQQYLAERISPATVAGRPAVLADVGPSGIGQRAVFVLDAEVDGSTALLSSNVELGLLRSIAENLYR